MKGYRWIMIGLAFACHSVDAFACAAKDIEIRQSGWHMDGDYAHIVGEILNGCTVPVGVELEATFKNKASQIVIVSEFWPASTSNIPSNTDFRFDMTEHATQPVETMTLTVSGVRQW